MKLHIYVIAAAVLLATSCKKEEPVKTPETVTLETNAASCEMLDWVKTFGSNARQEGYGAHVDNAGNIYVKGAVTGQGAVIDVDPGPGVVNVTGYSNYIIKLNASGDFGWVRRMPAPNCPTAIGSDSFYYLFRDGNYTLYITKLNSSTGLDVWTKKLDIQHGLNGPLLTVDRNNNVYISGMFSSPGADLDPGPGVFNVAAATKSRFVVKLNSNGNFVSAVAAPAIYGAYQLLVDNSGNVIVPYTKDGVSTVGYIAKYSPFAKQLYSISQGGAPGDIYIDGSSNVYRHYKTELSKFSSTGSPVWKRNIIYDKFSSATVDNLGNTYLTHRNDKNMGKSTRLIKVTAMGTLGYNKPLFDYTTYAKKYVYQYVEPQSLHVTNTGALYASGGFNGTINFDPAGTDGIIIGPQSAELDGSVFAVKLNLCE